MWLVMSRRGFLKLTLLHEVSHCLQRQRILLPVGGHARTLLRYTNLPASLKTPPDCWIRKIRGTSSFASGSRSFRHSTNRSTPVPGGWVMFYTCVSNSETTLERPLQI